MKIIKLTVESNDKFRIDKFISNEVEELTRNAVTNLILDEKVKVNEQVVGKSYKVLLNDLITVEIPDPKQYNAKPEDIPLDIIYEDNDLLVVNKPKGMVVHPAAGNYEGTLVNALLFHCKDSLSGINGVMRPGIVHRIDKNTSGLLIVAKNDNAHKFLSEQIKEHSFKREYEAIVCGLMKQEKGTINAAIGRHPVKRKQMCVTNINSKEAITHYEVIQSFKRNTHLRVRLETGRTHQIRVHLAAMNRPVFNDDVYGKVETKDFEGQCLHAKSIGFIHPNGEYMEFESELPDYFNKILDKLKKEINVV